MKYFIKNLAIYSLLLSTSALAQSTAQSTPQVHYPMNFGASSKVNPQVNTQVNTQVNPQTPTLNQPPVIVSSINPINQIAKFISGDDKSNSLLINPRASERDYVIGPGDIVILSKADVIFYVSDDLENNLPAALAKVKTTPKIVQLIQSKNIQPLTFQNRKNKENIDPHIWLNPENAIGIAIEIADTLSALYPTGSDAYKKNLEQFKVDVRNMDKANKMELLKVRPKSFVMDLNSTIYFEDYYHMPSAGAIRYDLDYEFTFKEIDAINDMIKREKVVCVLGSYQERSGLAFQVAGNNKVKFILIDIIGGEINYNQNGYTKMMTGLVSDLVKCVGK